jgi:two-component system LytT family response regulator
MQSSDEGLHRIRAAIVGEESHSRLRLRDCIAGAPDFRLVGEFGSGVNLIRALDAMRPEVLFADIDMPDESAFDLVDRIRLRTPLRPSIVFVTATGSHAARAFDADATDYLLRPFDAQRFAQTLERVRKRIAASAGEEISLSDRLMTRVAVRLRDRTQLIRMQDVDWIEAAANYVRLHLRKEAYLFRASMAGIEQRLDPERFVRIHRSTIVNVDRIVELRPTFNREQIVLLTDGTELRLSDTFRDRLSALVHGL